MTSAVAHKMQLSLDAKPSIFFFALMHIKSYMQKLPFQVVPLFFSVQKEIRLKKKASRS